MKKFIFGIIIALSVVFLLPHIGMAADTVDINVKPEGPLLTGVDANDIIRFVLQLLVAIGVLLSLLFLIYGGIKWITSGGDKAAVEAAQKHIVAAIVGLVVVILAFVIISFVIQLLGVEQNDIFNLHIRKLNQNSTNTNTTTTLTPEQRCQAGLGGSYHYDANRDKCCSRENSSLCQEIPK